MNLKLPENKNELISKKNSLVKDLDSFLDEMIDNPICYKRAALIYYWLRDYKNYIKNEKNFDPKFLPTFQRGQIVSVNMGYNLGSELGGRHFALVLAESNNKNPNLTIIPLQSKKTTGKLHKSEIDLGNSLYNILLGKQIAMSNDIVFKLKELRKKSSDLHKLRKNTLSSDLSDYVNNEIQEINETINNIEKQEETLKKIRDQLLKMKLGSIACLSQIKTISKMRIIDPKSELDILFKVKLPSDSLTLIDDRLIQLYTNKKLDFK